MYRLDKIVSNILLGWFQWVEFIELMALNSLMVLDNGSPQPLLIGTCLQIIFFNWERCSTFKIIKQEIVWSEMVIDPAHKLKISLISLY